jgi:hypothetical protein
VRLAGAGRTDEGDVVVDDDPLQAGQVVEGVAADRRGGEG